MSVVFYNILSWLQNYVKSFATRLQTWALGYFLHNFREIPYWQSRKKRYLCIEFNNKDIENYEDNEYCYGHSRSLDAAE